MQSRFRSRPVTAQPEAERRRHGPTLTLSRRLWPSLLLSLMALAVVVPASAQASADLGSAIRVANSVLPAVSQRCGSVSIEVGPLSAQNAGASAESWYVSCKVRYAPQTFDFATQAQAVLADRARVGSPRGT